MKKFIEARVNGGSNYDSLGGGAGFMAPSGECSGECSREGVYVLRLGPSTHTSAYGGAVSTGIPLAEESSSRRLPAWRLALWSFIVAPSGHLRLSIGVRPSGAAGSRRDRPEAERWKAVS